MCIDFDQIMNKTATIIGASGLIGSELLTLLLNDETYTNVRVIVRSALPIKQINLEQVIIDFSDIGALQSAINGSEVVFCSIGTTNKKVKGDKDAYHKVDFDIPVNSAKACAKADVKIFVLISAVGANAKSNNFYLNLKGRVEVEIKKTGITQIFILQPSVLLGKRNEKRIGEQIGQVIISFLSPLLIKIFQKYKPIKASAIARVMLILAKKKNEGIHTLTFKDMEKLL